MEKIKVKIILISTITLFVLILISFINAKVLNMYLKNPLIKPWHNFIICIDVFVYISLIILILGFNGLKLLFKIEKIGERSIINILIVLICLIMFIVFSSATYLLYGAATHQEHSVLILTLIIFVLIISMIVVTGAVSIMFAVLIYYCCIKGALKVCYAGRDDD